MTDASNCDLPPTRAVRPTLPKDGLDICARLSLAREQRERLPKPQERERDCLQRFGGGALNLLNIGSCDCPVANLRIAARLPRSQICELFLWNCSVVSAADDKTMTIKLSKCLRSERARRSGNPTRPSGR